VIASVGSWRNGVGVTKDAQSAVRGLHEIYRRLRWPNEGSLSAVARARREVRRAKKIHQASRRFSREREDVASTFRVSRLRQLVDSARFSFAENIDLESYYRFSLFLPENCKRR
jgi:hypothetical protein